MTNAISEYKLNFKRCFKVSSRILNYITENYNLQTAVVVKNFKDIKKVSIQYNSATCWPFQYTNLSRKDTRK